MVFSAWSLLPWEREEREGSREGVLRKGERVRSVTLPGERGGWRSSALGPRAFGCWVSAPGEWGPSRGRLALASCTRAYASFSVSIPHTNIKYVGKNICVCGGGGGRRRKGVAVWEQRGTFPSFPRPVTTATAGEQQVKRGSRFSVATCGSFGAYMKNRPTW